MGMPRKPYKRRAEIRQEEDLSTKTDRVTPDGGAGWVEMPSLDSEPVEANRVIFE